MNKNKLFSVTIGLVILIASSGIVSSFFLNIGNKNISMEKIRVACVGDSITEGFDYPNQLWMLLGVNFTVINFGVGASTIALNSSKPYMNQSVFEEAKNFQPNVVIIMLGTNDANPLVKQNSKNLVDDYVKLINEFQVLSSKPKIWIVKPPPIFSNNTGLSPEKFKNNVIPGIDQLAEEVGLPIINLYSAFTNYPDFFPDGVHPNAEGATLISKEIYKAIT